MSFVDADLKREISIACNKALVSMAPDEIVAVLTEVSEDLVPPTPPEPPPDGD
jgi:hypothetical protein